MNARRISKRAGNNLDAVKLKEIADKKTKAKRVINTRGAKRVLRAPNPLLKPN
jgi:hypothetical protein